ncbi:rRNA maturation RNase YbeY [Croceitalea marina]|uniref:Endoribonuclease YbeY n=1 Tax=Croceitalea marina TaxID=1775166 RepID=A0ABW5MXL4_9FLAO
MKVDFHYEVDFRLEDSLKFSDWISRIIEKENSSLGNLSYIFCDDEYLSNINLEYLNHDTLTDIITFDYTENNTISGDVFISVERVKENAEGFKVEFRTELLRVMSHGVLHLLGYNDKGEEEKAEMRNKESEMIELFHVEQ